jgi:hypothetical protein
VGTRWRSWLKHCATYRKVTGSIHQSQWPSWSRNSLLLWNPDVSFFSFHNNATIIPILSLKTPIHKLQTSSFTKCVNITLPTTLNLPNFPFPCGFPKKFGMFLTLPNQYTIQFFHTLVIFSFKFSSQYSAFVSQDRRGTLYRERDWNHWSSRCENLSNTYHKLQRIARVAL